MGPEKSLFTMALGLEAPWHVDDVSFDAASKQIDFVRPKHHAASMIGGSVALRAGVCAAIARSRSLTISATSPLR